MTIRRILAVLCMCCASVATYAASPYMPTFTGTFRGFFEQSTYDGSSRFMVRNARVAATGAPVDFLEYKIQLDLYDRGKFKVNDVYVSVLPCKGLKFSVGQQRVPFSIGASRSTHLRPFLNRSFVGKHTANLRSMGLKAAYDIRPLRTTLEAGIFNGTDDQSVWHKGEWVYSVKATCRPANGISPALAFMSRVIDKDRINICDASFTYDLGSWFVEAEGAYVRWSGRDSWQWNAAAQYRMKIRSRMANRLSFEGRFDGTNDGPDGLRSMRRITAGTTVSYVAAKFHADIKINYEQYFPAEGSRIAAGIILHF